MQGGRVWGGEGVISYILLAPPGGSRIYLSMCPESAGGARMGRSRGRRKKYLAGSAARLADVVCDYVGSTGRLAEIVNDTLAPLGGSRR